MSERVQKWLATRGVGSRRQVEAWVAAGRITVNGKPATPGQKVGPRDRVCVDGQPVAAGPAARADFAHRTLVYHKPAGEICTRRDPEGRPTVFDALPRLRGQRWVNVGRLDVQTSGLLIFTTDGQLASRLMHPSTGLEREYAVRVQGELAPEAEERLRRGVQLPDGTARFEAFEFAGGDAQNRWYRVIVSEGRNRLVRRLIEAEGGRVSRLIRTRFGPLALPRGLARGRSRELTGEDLAALYAAAGLPPPVAPARPRRGHVRRRPH